MVKDSVYCGSGITWNYSYNPSGEREQKRLVSTPLRNFGGGVFAWEYYLLGGTNEQLAVYQGVEQSDEVIAGLAPDGSSCSIPNPRDPQNITIRVNQVFFYPAEFNTYGLGGAPLTWRADSVGQWRKEYKLFDHLGSVRTVLRKGLDDNSYEVREQISYEPFGGVKNRLYCTGSATPDARLKYIGKQKDGESALADHGVRKYDYNLGQFTSVDPLWEKYYAWTPYHYCGNNPMMAVDPSGKFDVGWHIKLDLEIGDCNWLGSAVFHGFIDGPCFMNKYYHFDNFNNFSEIKDAIDSQGGYANLNRHSVADLYCHTNYVEIWNSVNTDPNAIIPLYDEVDWNSDFGKALQKDLKSTVWPDDGSPRGHDNGAKHGGFSAKDNPPEPDDYGNYTEEQLKEKELYIQSSDVGERAVRKSVQEED